MLYNLLRMQLTILFVLSAFITDGKAQSARPLVVASGQYKLKLFHNGNGVSVADDKGNVLLDSVGGLWRAKLENGKNVYSRDCHNGLEMFESDNQIGLLYKSEELDVKLLVVCEEGKIRFIPKVKSHKQPVIEFAVPDRIIYPVDSGTSLFTTGMTGMELRDSFFRPIPIEKAIFAANKKIGNDAAGKFLASLKIRDVDAGAEKAELTDFGRKWFGCEIDFRDQKIAPRFPSTDSEQKVLVSSGGRPIVTLYQIGKGIYIRFCNKHAGMDGVLRFYRPVLKALLGRIINESDSTVRVGHLCRDLGTRDLDSCRNHLGKISFSVGRESGKGVEVALLRTIPDFQKGIEGQRAVDVVFNMFEGGLPCSSPDKWRESLDSIKSYIQGGGIWVDYAGGYPFANAWYPSRWNGSFVVQYPDGGGGFSDFVYSRNPVQPWAIYGVQPININPVFEPLAPDQYPYKTWYGIETVRNDKQDNEKVQGRYFRFANGYSRVGEWHSFPVTVISTGKQLRESYLEYGAENNIVRTLAEKMDKKLLETWKRSLFLKVNDRDSKISQWIDFVKKWDSPGPILYHHADWSHKDGRFDQYYPDYFPLRPHTGDENSVKAFYETCHQKGSIAMPYTNPTFWDLSTQRFSLADRPLLTKAVYGLAVRRKNQGLDAIHGGLTYMSQWNVAVRSVNLENCDKFVNKLGADIFFHDSIGAECAREDYSGNAPYPTADLYGKLALAAAHRNVSKAPLATEGGGDQYINQYSMFCGMSQFIAPTVWSVYKPYVERFGIGTLRPFPFAQFLMHDKILLIGHNLGNSVVSREMVTWWIVLGMNLQNSIDLGQLKKSTKSKDCWVDALSILQSRVIGPHIAGRKMKACRYAEEDVLQALYDETLVTANLKTTHCKMPDGVILAPWGFRVKNASIDAGIIETGSLEEKTLWYIKEKGKETHVSVSEENDIWEPYGGNETGKITFTAGKHKN